MSTAILDAEKIPGQSLDIKTVIPANPTAVYQFRAQRLAELAQDSGLTEYFGLLEQLVNAQQKVSAFDGEAAKSCFGLKPRLDLTHSQPMVQEHFEWGNYWQSVLLELLSELMPKVSTELHVVLKTLARADSNELQGYAKSMLGGHFAEVPAQYSLFIWAALSVYWSHWAVDVAEGLAATGESHRRLCPVCGSHPVGSVIKDEPRTGLRYLHCSLCETQWHEVRAECTACGESKGVNLWAETESNAAIRIESCDTCKGYTKMFFTDINPKLEVAVDDLATMVMDNHLVDHGYSATTVNPLLLAHEQEPQLELEQQPKVGDIH
ncbi:formate dehydrogenase accessory protein FdhE [Shewanella sp. D64]|uniref:formate dehydrogenase accessory protein FdhE n=1 Tax=unclassified Shewanella TaxID=196818 RepID=UPI0022BA5406|nr:MULTISPECIES: formate dehydrogenase accessory protein FdhE [unclassified Shewanella]MEC4724388.1 formate dehydrogenase accessory protein FdhE [Shewanella sp. D64]MEC4736835.1 formate dehydrogenase accessory protein FdhE [Shewanella sp. E94]WBJ94506.1 formate dehydrogenase accessory protein FdhE [Shewanella sp. MTB7]